jgi:hypothetical protein
MLVLDVDLVTGRSLRISPPLHVWTVILDYCPSDSDPRSKQT